MESFDLDLSLDLGIKPSPDNSSSSKSSRVNKVYFCRICGNEVKFTKDGGGKLICCNEEMKIKKEGFDGEE